MSLLCIALHETAYAVDFDARDTRVDLPVLSIPNNAVTPHMSVDQAGHVYMVWSDNRGGSPRIYANTFLPVQGWQPRAIQVNTGFPRPEGAPVGDATSPKICSDNSGHVYVVWVDDRAVKAGTGKIDIYFRYSKNYGLTWYPEFTDERIDTDSPTAGDSINPEIACDEDGNVYVAWEDNRHSLRRYNIYFRSFQIQFSKPTDFISYRQTPDLRLDTGVVAGRYEARWPALSTDKKGNIYVAWQDTRSVPESDIYPGIYFNVSRNHGSTWQSEAIQVDRAPIGGFLFFSPPAIGSDSNGNVYVAWIDNAGRAVRGKPYAPDGTGDVYFNRSTDGGMTWDEEDQRIEKLNSPDHQAEVKDVAIANNNRGMVWIAWADNRAGAYNIYASHSEDYGRSFPDSEIGNLRINLGVEPGTTEASSPRIKVDNLGNIFVAWVDNRTGVSDIFFNFSIEKGKAGSWQIQDRRLDYPNPPGNSINPVMSIDNLGHVYIGWQDSRNALAKDNYNIYYRSGFLDVETLLIAGQRLGEACFIATAAYGTPFERNVELLREFRDKYLLTNIAGRRFVSLYYRLSPPVAHFITEHGYLRSAVRTALLPAVGIAALFIYTTAAQKMVLIFVIGAIIGSAPFILAKRKK